MTEQGKDLTQGVEPMIGDRPVVTITNRNGEETQYQMRYLGIQDTFKIMQIVAQGAGYMGGNVLDKIQKIDSQTMLMLVLAGIPFAEKQALSLLASIIGVEYADITNPDLFPIGSEIDIVEKLVKHQDLKAFFGKLAKLAKVNPAVKNMIQTDSPGGSM